MANDCLRGKEVIFLRDYWDDIVYEGIENGVIDKEDFFQDKNDSAFRDEGKTIEPEVEQEVESEDLQELPIIRAYQMTHFVLCVSSIMHKISRGEIHEGENKWQEKNGTKITLELTQRFPKPLSAFDMAVYTAVVSLIDGDIEEFSDATVCRTLCLNPKMSRVSAHLARMVRESLEKLAHIKVKILVLPKDGGGNEYRGEFLELEEFEGLTENGKPCLFWRSKRMPVLCKYSKEVNHIWKRRLHLVQTGKEFSNTINAITIRYCLLRRVAIISRMEDRQGKIDYAALLKEVGMPNRESSRREIKRITKGCLRCWKERGLIKDYQIYKKKRKEAGVNVEA